MLFPGHQHFITSPNWPFSRTPKRIFFFNRHEEAKKGQQIQISACPIYIKKKKINLRSDSMGKYFPIPKFISILGKAV